MYLEVSLVLFFDEVWLNMKNRCAKGPRFKSPSCRHLFMASFVYKKKQCDDSNTSNAEKDFFFKKKTKRIKVLIFIRF